MGLFSKPEIVILKESSDAKIYLEKLEEILPKAKGDLKDRIQKEIAITKAGIAGEENILFELKNSGMDMVVLHDIYIETQDGRGAQIDFIVFAACGVFLIECKNLVGNIEIDSKGNFIRTIEYGGKNHREGIYSPITQNERHLSVLVDRRKEDKNFLSKMFVQAGTDIYFTTLVVLANPKTIVNDRYAKKEIKNQVIRADQLIKVIKEKNDATSKLMKYSKTDMKNAAQAILDKNIEERKDYFVKFEEMLKELEAQDNLVETNQDNKSSEEYMSPKLICPKCGSELVLRTARNGANAGQKFYGCSGYPKCRYILNIK